MHEFADRHVHTQNSLLADRVGAQSSSQEHLSDRDLLSDLPGQYKDQVDLCTQNICYSVVAVSNLRAAEDRHVQALQRPLML